MATHTHTGGSYVRKFSISRENGQADKNGRPYFFEWLKEMPPTAEQAGRKFETRKKSNGDFSHYELFSALSGRLTGISLEQKSIGDKPETWLVLSMTDGPEDYKIEVGQYDGRYALDIMKRLLDPAFNPNANLRLSPYSITDREGKQNIGLFAMSGVDDKLSASKDVNANLEGIPQASSAAFKDRTLWDFSPVADWLFAELRKKVIPNLAAGPAAPASFPVSSAAKPASNAAPVSVPESDFDDLPF